MNIILGLFRIWWPWSSKYEKQQLTKHHCQQNPTLIMEIKDKTSKVISLILAKIKSRKRWLYLFFLPGELFYSQRAIDVVVFM